MLKRLHADNYRCLVNFEVTLPEIALLVGQNGGGKTSVWEVLAGIQDVLVNGAAVEGSFPTDSLTRWDARSTQRFELAIELAEGTFAYTLEVAHDRERRTARIGREELSYEGATLYRFEGGDVQLFSDIPTAKPRAAFPADPRRSFLSVLEPRSDNRKTIAFREAVAGIWLLRLNPYAMESTSRREAEWLARDGSNFTSWLRALIQEDPKIVTPLNADLAKVFPGFRGIRFAKMGAEAKELILDFEAEGVSGSYTLTPGDLSEGQRVLLMLYGVLHAASTRAQVFGFDEPENFVALPEIQPWLQKVAGLVRDQGAQAFMVSHNPEVIDYLAAEQVLVLSRPGGGPTRARPLDVPRDSGVSASRWLALGMGND